MDRFTMIEFKFQCELVPEHMALFIKTMYVNLLMARKFYYITC